MPDLFGYDRRTRFSRAAENAATSALGYIGREVGQRVVDNLYGASYNISASLAKRALARYKARFNMPSVRRTGRLSTYGRRYRRRYRKKGRKFAGRARGKRWGQKRRVVAPLYRNLAINDYKTIKLQRYLGTITIDATAPPNTVTQWNVGLNEFLGAGAGNDFGTDYLAMHEMYRIKNMQFAIIPRTTIKSNMNASVQAGQLPYLYVKVGPPTNEAAPVNPRTIDIQQTPGIVYFPINQTRRKIFSQTPLLKYHTEIEVNGANPDINRFKRFPWLEKQLDIATEPVAASFTVIRPTFEAGVTAVLHFDVWAYCTVGLRQNNNLLIQE